MSNQGLAARMALMPKNADAAFNKWCDQIDAIGRMRGCDFDYTHHTGRETWREMFEDGRSPRDALDEEFSAAAGDLE